MFGSGHITVFVSLFAVDDSIVNNEHTYRKEIFVAYAGVVSVSIG